MTDNTLQQQHQWPWNLYLTTECFGQDDFLMTEDAILAGIHALNNADPNGKPLTIDHAICMQFVKAQSDNTTALYQSTSETAYDGWTWPSGGLGLKVENPALTCWPAKGFDGKDGYRFYDPDSSGDVEGFES